MCVIIVNFSYTGKKISHLSAGCTVHIGVTGVVSLNQNMLFTLVLHCYAKHFFKLAPLPLQIRKKPKNFETLIKLLN